jgi:excinuclease ABC subunit B
MGPGTDTETPLFRKPDLNEMGRDVATPAGVDKSLFRRKTLDEKTVGRAEKPVIGHVPEKPILTRAKPGVGSYEDPVDQKRQKGRTKGKTGRPGR